MNWIKKIVPIGEEVDRRADAAIEHLASKLDKIRGSNFFYREGEDIPVMAMHRSQMDKWIKIDEDTDWFSQIINLPNEFELKTTNWNALFGFGKKGARLATHTHPQRERVWVLEGSMHELISDQVYEPGHRVADIAGGVKHGWKMLENTFYIIQFEPPMDMKIVEDEIDVHDLESLMAREGHTNV